MIKIALLFLMLTSLFATSVKKPDARYMASGAVTDLVYDSAKLYAATSASCVDIFDVNKKSKIKTITIPQIKDFMGDAINAKVFSVDVLGDKVLLLSQAEHGYRKVEIFENMKSINAVTTAEKLHIAKAKFLDKETLLLGLLSNDIISYNFVTHKRNWTVQASQSKFSNFALNEDKSKVVISDESGDLHLLSTKDGKLLKVLSGENLDNVFQVVFKNNIIATAGQDRRSVIYDLKSNSAYYMKAPFIVYSVGLSPKGKIAAYSYDENNNIMLFNTATKSKLGLYGGNKMTLTNILFINEKEFFVSSDDKVINYYKIK
ncbi:WD40 repeat domain-containing protein [Sulfurimonas sp.]|uniref:WD40 repeat domain-containing protein n=1 Tax=Sulfurimonas sp. TaxID=2022749 RepID=UPI00262009E9|nr:WD40 repeat domain-containing protein [Sulfurimonas sp.]